MKNLIIPMGGKSTRFPGVRPKWMLTHPVTGNFMCIESIKGINLEFFDKIFFIILKEHEDEHQASVGISRSLETLSNYNELKERIEIIYLDSGTGSQSETVYLGILQKNIDGFIYIKDSDGYFDLKIDSTNNQLAYFDINNTEEINARSKSYIETNSNGAVTNIVEKKVISSKFSSGGYGFSSAIEFCSHYEKISGYPGECYISNVILDMILSGKLFNSIESSNYLDWGTIDSWNSYKSKFKCTFIELEGVILTDTSHLSPPFTGSGLPLSANIEKIRKIHREGSYIAIITSRPEKYRIDTEKELRKHAIPFDTLIMGLPNCQRVIVSNFSEENPYPYCSSINIPKNIGSLSSYIGK